MRAVIDGTRKSVNERVEYNTYGRPKLWLGADVNHTRQIDFFDTSVFVGWYGSGDERGDLDGDGDVDFFDYSAFLVMYNAQRTAAR